MKNKISVIICHHKGETLLFNTIDSIKKSYDVDYEIIVATSSEEFVKSFSSKYPDVRFINVQGGPANKRNVATRFANGQYFAFFDDDVEVTPLALFNMQRELEKDGVGMVYGKLLNMEFRDRFDEAGSFLTSTGFLLARCESGILDKGQFEDVCPILAGKSASCMVHRKVFWEALGFDVSYEILGEETDLSWRIWLIGYSVVFVPKSVTYHAFNTKFKPADFYIPKRVYFNGSRNYLSMLTTNLEYRNLIIPLCVQLIVWFLAAMGMFITGKMEAGKFILKGIFWYFTNLPHILLKRKYIQNKRVISDSELFKFIKRNPSFSYYYNRFFHYIKTGRHG